MEPNEDLRLLALPIATTSPLEPRPLAFPLTLGIWFDIAGEPET